MSVILEDTVRGKFHQGDISHFNPNTAGRQCMANAIAAAVYATMVLCDCGIHQCLIVFYWLEMLCTREDAIVNMIICNFQIYIQVKEYFMMTIS